ncbi:MAG: hypothetical protein WCF03_11510, partial [Nitrososphaeraceae archaeon]
SNDDKDIMIKVLASIFIFYATHPLDNKFVKNKCVVMTHYRCIHYFYYYISYIIIIDNILLKLDSTLLFSHKRLLIGAWIPELTCR